MNLEKYKSQNPALKIEEYFNGPIKAYGILQDMFGNVTRRFGVDMVGTWNGNDGVLKEHFVYDDGELQERTWTIKSLGNGMYEGTAGDIAGKADGRAMGNAVQWSYDMDLKVNGHNIRIKFDDWMFLVDENNLVNRSYLKKFGIKVAELSIFMQK